VGHFGSLGTNCPVLSVVWHVALLGSDRQLQRLDQANLVSRFAGRILVGKLPVLLFRVSSSSISEGKGRGLRTMFRRILVSGWAFIFGSVALLGLFPKLATRIPHPEYIRIFLVPFMLVSIVYGVFWLYRQGMKRAKK